MEAEQVDNWDRLRELLQADDRESLSAFLSTLSGAEVVRAMFRLDEDEQRALLLSVPRASAAEIIEDVPDAHAADLMEGMSAADAASIIEELPSDEKADVLAEVEDEDADAIIEEMDLGSAAEVRELLSYPSQSAGGLMIREYLAYPGSTTARDVLREVITGRGDVPRDAMQLAYVVDGRGRLRGVVRLRELVARDPTTPLDAVMRPASVVNDHADLNTLDDCFEEIDDLALAVNSDDGMMRGVVLRSDMEEALTQRAEEDHLKSQGIVGGEELRSMPVAQRSSRRLKWLSLNIVLNVIAASVIAAFEDTLTAVIALAVFLPIVSDMSGCSGNQAVAVSMRELTIGIVNVKDVLRVWWQEAQVGVINGIVLGILLGAAAWAWKGNPALGAVVGSALAINTLVAVSIGGTVPLLLKRFGADPAVASGPVLTTVTDMCGFFLVLGIATAALPLL